MSTARKQEQDLIKKIRTLAPKRLAKNEIVYIGVGDSKGNKRYPEHGLGAKGE